MVNSTLIQQKLVCHPLKVLDDSTFVRWHCESLVYPKAPIKQGTSGLLCDPSSASLSLQDGNVTPGEARTRFVPYLKSCPRFSTNIWLKTHRSRLQMLNVGCFFLCSAFRQMIGFVMLWFVLDQKVFSSLSAPTSREACRPAVARALLASLSA